MVAAAVDACIARPGATAVPDERIAGDIHRHAEGGRWARHRGEAVGSVDALRARPGIAVPVEHVAGVVHRHAE